MEHKFFFLLIGAFWLVILIGFIAVKEFTLLTGQEVLLKTRPVDPRDLFRGDYVTLRYEISTLDLSRVAAEATTFKTGDTIYVSLRIQEGYGLPAMVGSKPQENGVYVKGTVRDVLDSRIFVEYGIESYFVPEGRGRQIEHARGKDLEVKVSIDWFGNAVIKSLLIDGEEVQFE